MHFWGQETMQFCGTGNNSFEWQVTLQVGGGGGGRQQCTFRVLETMHIWGASKKRTFRELMEFIERVESVQRSFRGYLGYHAIRIPLFNIN